jgi:excisionase family DNA binding protein
MPSVYALGDPRTSQIRYIGIAQDVYKRYAQHLNHPHSNEMKNAWMNEIKQSGIVPTLTILETDVDESIIYGRERHWIQHYLELGAPLTNIVHAQQPMVKKDKEVALTRLRDGKLLSAKQVQGILNLSESTFLRLMKRKELKGFKVGREWRFEESDINDYIERQRQKAEGLIDEAA